MAGLYVKLDAEYAADDKMIEAGPLAELLYVRGLCFAKRTMLDGKISRGQLTSVGIGIPNPGRHAARLVAVGAWVTTRHGWQIAAWLRRNKSASTIGAESEAKRVASQTANHERWHVKEGKPSLTCPLCDPVWEAKFVRTGSSTESTEPKAETESEPEAEVKPEAETESVPGQSSSQLTGAPTAPPTTEEDDFLKTIALIAEAKAIEYPRPISNLPAWLKSTRGNLIDEHGPAIAEALASVIPTTPEECAARFVAPTWVRMALRARAKDQS